MPHSNPKPAPTSISRNQAPWREVVHCELRTNTRGKEAWKLRLECGHHKQVSLPALQFIPPMVTMTERHPTKSRSAPKKCRCQLCFHLQKTP